jgi:predicted transcriptional regulator
LLSKKNLQLFEIPDGIRVAFTIADDMLFLGLYNLNGSYDPNSDLICQGQEAKEWGMELFEHYLKQSRIVTGNKASSMDSSLSRTRKLE